MTHEVIISGFGGQGVLSLGKILAYSGMMEGKEVTWMPAYGPEQRGGTANVTVVISDEQIASPILSQYDVVVVLNQPSLDKFESRVKSGGVLIYDENSVINLPTRDDIVCHGIQAMEQSALMGNAKVFNMIILGAMLKACPMVSRQSVEASLYNSLPERHHRLIPLNMQAIDAGAEMIAV